MNLEGLVLEHTYKKRVRYADTDKMGVVYNGNYLAYFEIGRNETMRSYGLPYTIFEENGILLPVIEAYVKYIDSAYYDDLLEINTIVKPEYKPTVKFEYNIFRGNSTIAKGFTVHSYLNNKTRKPVRPPKFFFDELARINKKQTEEL